MYRSPSSSSSLSFSAPNPFLSSADQQLISDRTFDPTRVYRNEIAGGKMSETYESLVRNIFRPEQSRQESSVFLPPSFAPPSAHLSQQQFGKQYRQNTVNGQQSTLVGGVPSPSTNGRERPRISAAAMKRIEDQLGKDVLDDSHDDELWKSPLDEIYAELGIDSSSASSPFAPAPFHSALSSAYTSPSSSDASRRRRPAPGLVSEYSVYVPKCSAEYAQLANSSPPAQPSYRSSTLGAYRLGMPSSMRSSSSAFDRSGRKSDSQRTLVDFKEFSSSSLSPSMYRINGQNSSYDSRIVGTNFVQVSRPKDRFLEKIDQTLAEVRSSPRYTLT
ncbi:hypothetical protein niasHT_015561 [Heterodera trifolii]